MWWCSRWKWKFYHGDDDNDDLQFIIEVSGSMQWWPFKKSGLFKHETSRSFPKLNASSFLSCSALNNTIWWNMMTINISSLLDGDHLMNVWDQNWSWGIISLWGNLQIQIMWFLLLLLLLLLQLLLLLLRYWKVPCFMVLTCFMLLTPVNNRACYGVDSCYGVNSYMVKAHSKLSTCVMTLICVMVLTRVRLV